MRALEYNMPYMEPNGTQPTPTKAQTKDTQLKPPPPLHHMLHKNPNQTHQGLCTEHDEGKKTGLLCLWVSTQSSKPIELL